MFAYLIIIIVGLFAGTLSGVIGTGSSLILIPVLSYFFEPRTAISIMAISAIMSNIARIVAWRKSIDWRAFFAYSLPAIPMAALGAKTLFTLSPTLLDITLGTFFLAVIPVRRWLDKKQLKISITLLAIAGAFIGFLTGIVMSTGPISVPIFIGYGLSGGVFLGTEAAGSLAIYITKAITFKSMGVLPLDIIIKGILVGCCVIPGTFIGKNIIQRISTKQFHFLIDILLLYSGLSFLWSALFS